MNRTYRRAFKVRADRCYTAWPVITLNRKKNTNNCGILCPKSWCTYHWLASLPHSKIASPKLPSELLHSVHQPLASTSRTTTSAFYQPRITRCQLSPGPESRPLHGERVLVYCSSDVHGGRLRLDQPCLVPLLCVSLNYLQASDAEVEMLIGSRIFVKIFPTWFVAWLFSWRLG